MAGTYGLVLKQMKASSVLKKGIAEDQLSVYDYMYQALRYYKDTLEKDDQPRHQAIKNMEFEIGRIEAAMRSIPPCRRRHCRACA